MFNIIKMDLYKMIKSKAFYVTHLALISMILLGAVFMRVSLSRDYDVGKDSSFGFGAEEVSEKMTNAPDITEEEYYLIQNSIKDDLNTSTVISSSYKSPIMLMLFTAFMAIFIGSELDNGYIKNIVPLTNSRFSLIVSKNFIGTLFIITQAVVAFISSIIATVIISGKMNLPDINSLIIYVSLQGLLMIAFSSLIILISYLFKNKTITVAIGMLLSFNVVGTLLNAVDGIFGVLDIGLAKLTVVGNSVMEQFNTSDYSRIAIVFIAYFLVYNIMAIVRVKSMEFK